MMFKILITLVLIILSVITWYFYKILSYWKDRNVLSVSPIFPFGNLKNVGKTVNYALRIQELYKKFKGQDLICGFYFLTTPQVILLDLDLVKAITIKDFYNFADRGLYYHKTADPLSAHLFTMEGGEKWKYLRTKLSPSFTSGKLKTMFSTLMNVSNEFNELLSNYMKSDKVIDAKDICSRFIIDAIGASTLGINCNCVKTENSEMVDIAQSLFNFREPGVQFQFVFQNAYVNFARKLKLRLINIRAEKYFLALIKDIFKYRQENKQNKNDFINILMQIPALSANEKNFDVDNVGPLTTEVLEAQAFIFFFAGFEPTATTMHFCLYELAKNQDIQNKLRDEINQVIEQNNGELTYKATMEMFYLDNIINETLRKYSPVSTLFRKALVDYKIPGTSHIIEKDMEILIPVYSIHNDSEIFENPNRFDPDRFTAENIKKRHPYSFLAFGEGPRHCAGKRFSYLLLRLGLANMIRNFKLNLNPKTANPIVIEPTDVIFIIAATGGIWLNIKKV